jgi:hypothetical protein
MKTLKKISIFVALFSMAISFTACGDTKQNFAEQMAKEINAQKHMLSNSQVRIDKAEALPNYTVKTTATIFGADADYFFLSESDLETVKTTLIEYLRTQPDFNQIKLFGISLLYVYVDEKGNQLYEVFVTPNDY